MPADTDRRVTVFSRKRDQTPDLSECISEGTDRALLHPCAAGKDNRMSAKQGKGSDEAQGCSGIIQIERGFFLYRKSAVAAGEGNPVFFPLDRNSQCRKSLCGKPGIFRVQWVRQNGCT